MVHFFITDWYSAPHNWPNAQRVQFLSFCDNVTFMNRLWYVSLLPFFSWASQFLLSQEGTQNHQLFELQRRIELNASLWWSVKASPEFSIAYLYISFLLLKMLSELNELKYFVFISVCFGRFYLTFFSYILNHKYSVIYFSSH